MKHLGLSFIKLFSSVMIVTCEHSLYFGSVRCETIAGNPSVLALHFCVQKLTSFMLLCDWSVQQSADRPQTQKKRNVVQM